MSNNLYYLRKKLAEGKPVDWIDYHNAMLPVYDKR